MLYSCIRFKESFASAYLHQAAWKYNTNKNELIYARIAGKPTFVKATAAGLMRGNYIRVLLKENDMEYLYGTENSKCLYFKTGKTALACYYSRKLFDPNSEETYIVGKDKDFIRKTFLTILKRKPILSYEKWNMVKVFSDLQLITELETYNIIAYEILWDTDRINSHISNLVKEKVLTF